MSILFTNLYPNLASGPILSSQRLFWKRSDFTVKNCALCPVLSVSPDWTWRQSHRPLFSLLCFSFFLFLLLFPSHLPVAREERVRGRRGKRASFRAASRRFGVLREHGLALPQLICESDLQLHALDAFYLGQQGTEMAES